MSLAIFNQRFAQAKPFILGAIFDALAGALQRIESVAVENQFRMSDFARWGCAIAEAIGYDAKDFISAYRANIGLQNLEAIDASQIAQAIEAFMGDREEWHGTPTDLYNELEKIAEDRHFDKKSETWPKAANWLWRRVAPMTSNLLARGIKVSRSSGEERVVTLTKVSEDAVDAVDGADEDENASETADSIANTAAIDTVGTEPLDGLDFDSMTASTAFPDENGGGWGD